MFIPPYLPTVECIANMGPCALCLSTYNETSVIRRTNPKRSSCIIEQRKTFTSSVKYITHYTSTWTTTLTHHTKVCSSKFVSKGEINWLSNTNWHLLVKSPRLRTLLILKTSNLFNGNLKLECSFHSVYNQMFYLQPAVPCLGWPVVLRLLLSFLCQCWKLILKLFWANNICRSFVPTLPHKLLDKI